MSAIAKWEDLVARGCLCGTDDRAHECPLHTKPGDNRGIGAWFKAGMPLGFPMVDCTCSVCGTSGCLIYPNIEHDDPKRSGENRRTLICPSCSTPGAERALVADAEQFGYSLNPHRVFAAVAA